MKLFVTPNSPYARKVRVVLIEKRIECELVEVDLSSPDSPLLSHNPLAKVPTLLLDDGTALYDSPVITEYLDKKTPVMHLIPAARRIEVRRWEALADGICDAAVAVVMEGRREESKRDEQLIARQQAKVSRGLRVLSEDLGGDKWCVGNSFGLADIAVGCALAYLGARMPATDWREMYPNLAALYARVQERPSFASTTPPGYS
ncbi:MAG TPA: glutathione S-transferase N-terminal domain-containing protein [Methylophilaceae bacterium]|jgi:glutathione S-transferase